MLFLFSRGLHTPMVKNCDVIYTFFELL